MVVLAIALFSNYHCTQPTYVVGRLFNELLLIHDVQSARPLARLSAPDSPDLNPFTH